MASANPNIMGILNRLAVQIAPLFHGQELEVEYFENELGTGGSSYWIDPHYRISLIAAEPVKALPFAQGKEWGILYFLDPEVLKYKEHVPVRVLSHPVLIGHVKNALNEIRGLYRQSGQDISFSIDACGAKEV